MKKFLTITMGILLFPLSFASCSGRSENPAVSAQEPSRTSPRAAAPEASSPQTGVPENFILIPGGTFTMGSPADEFLRESDETRRQVTVASFYMDRYEVTQREYRQLMGNNPSSFQDETLPVENVTWYEAVRYCNARSEEEGLAPAYTITGTGERPAVTWNREAGGYRLPTEAEWEYACRAGTITPFSTGAAISTNQGNYYGTYPYTIEEHYFSQNRIAVGPGQYRGRTVAPGSLPPNPWDLYEMHGNVWEWCWDWYSDYDAADWDNPAGPASGNYKVNRGGGWNDFARHLRSAYRAAYPPENRTFNIGFRLVRNV
ncbi:formylglycine-generating enzyme family protein [Brucepastera parasyntrophica]|uniref:formylglycine-generating enzyme family protein n=1 Tax=Brucepastera parasyntrophica TaxID=2880008 RepID=UPI00210A9C37|nr:formylglycine-generating enzyme family protein [Brucepastera parasyntrophica]ULQ60431.1 formylglycine-generating enzyme family protein [Brucepastera parasyntrophica]